MTELRDGREGLVELVIEIGAAGRPRDSFSLALLLILEPRLHHHHQVARHLGLVANEVRPSKTPISIGRIEYGVVCLLRDVGINVAAALSDILTFSPVVAGEA